MKTKISLLAISLISGATIFTACDKEGSSIASSTQTTTDAEIAVAAGDSAVGKDSVYLVHKCGNGSTRDSIAQADLPVAATAYLEENYSGYTFEKAFSVSDTTGTVAGYVAVIYTDGKPVGIEFSSEGDFVRILEQRFGRHRRGRHD